MTFKSLALALFLEICSCFIVRVIVVMVKQMYLFCLVKRSNSAQANSTFYLGKITILPRKDRTLT